ncbi:hypothetical protein ACFFFP_05425 [Thermus composti]|uniref:Lipoprotein n=1 Tax=Thermus composti TaxID=532059 RepID=A0ABV6Q0H0_9DEIN
MRKQSLLLFLGLVLTLAACSTDVFLQQPYRVRLEPAQLGYEVDDQGNITVVPNTAYVEVAPGAPGGYLERYEYLVVDDSGNEVAPGSSLGSGFVGVRVPPGYEEVEGQKRFVSTTSDHFTFSLDGQVAESHLQQGSPLNWRYQVTWYVTTSNGNTVSWTQEYQIQSPKR